MTRTIRRLSMVPTLVALTLASCTGADNADARAADGVVDATAELRADVANTLGRIDQEIASLRSAVAEATDHASEDLKQEWKLTMARLEADRTSVESELDRAYAATEDQVEELRAAMARDLAQLRYGLDRARLLAIQDMEQFSQALNSELARAASGMDALDADLEKLPSNIRAEYAAVLDGIRLQGTELAQRAGRLGQVDEGELPGVRAALADGLATLRRDLAATARDVQAHLESAGH